MLICIKDKNDKRFVSDFGVINRSIAEHSGNAKLRLKCTRFKRCISFYKISEFSK